MRRLVLAGGGHAHVEVLRRFGLEPEPDTEILVISPGAHTPYSGMLPGLVAGHYSFRESHIDLRALAGFAGARLDLARVAAIHPGARELALEDGRRFSYDVLSLDIGSVPPVGAIDGASAVGTAVKPVEGFLAALHQRIHDPAFRPGTVAVVGGGAGGVEIVLSLHFRFASVRGDSPARPPRFTLVAGPSGLLPDHPAPVRRLLADVLAARGIGCRQGVAVSRAMPGGLQLTGGDEVGADWIVWATGAAPAPWLRGTGLALDDRGFIRVGRALECVSHPGVFAAGDVASVDGDPRPRAGVFAVRQGPPLAENLRRALRGLPPVPFRLQRRALSLIGTGDRHAIASRGPFTASGRWVWCWKDRIDRRFMRTYALAPDNVTPGGPPVA